MRFQWGVTSFKAHKEPKLRQTFRWSRAEQVRWIRLTQEEKQSFIEHVELLYSYDVAKKANQNNRHSQTGQFKELRCSCQRKKPFLGSLPSRKKSNSSSQASPPSTKRQNRKDWNRPKLQIIRGMKNESWKGGLRLLRKDSSHRGATNRDDLQEKG